jgi:hypothetical protein
MLGRGRHGWDVRNRIRDDPEEDQDVRHFVPVVLHHEHRAKARASIDDHEIEQETEHHEEQWKWRTSGSLSKRRHDHAGGNDQHDDANEFLPSR